MKDEELIELLVEKAKKHDEKAFTKLIENIENQMYRIALLKLKNENDVYEAIQNTVISIYRNIEKLKDTKKFKSWAIKILMNECLKIINKNKKELDIYINYDERIGKTEYGFEKIESDNDLKKLLRNLNENEKIVISLYYGEGYTTKEIAEILSESEGTIKSRIRRAKTKIKTYIEEEKIL